MRTRCRTRHDAEKLLRSDLLRSAWMFAVGALDAYFCDAYTDIIAATASSKSRQPRSRSRSGSMRSSSRSGPSSKSTTTRTGGGGWPPAR